jgi:DNA-binding IclR family transcriptional regulator
MSGLIRLLSILDIFTPTTPVWPSDALIEHMECAPSTGYRYIKAMHEAGFLTRVANGSYALGPRILALDRTHRVSDPIYATGTPVIRRLAHKTGCSALLCELFGDSVVCVQRQLNSENLENLFDRGQSRPLFAGASAKAILAWLPNHQLKSLFFKHREAIEHAALGSDWESFRSTLRAIRAMGYAHTVSEFHIGIASIGAPLFNRQHEVVGSLVLAASTRGLDRRAFAALAPEVVAASQAVTQALAEPQISDVLAARALC